ncbi:hypothetical protein SAMN05660964_01710 [Thiothrix caldifontis]|uniref:Lipoprotein n=1 Tax=Thiothrix caldifontis TaxID=525918 RepID=A0A1H4BLS6_9GAMM|nr:hypothetical protein [Thiothrix caldifontis]SEA49004.1 hypothetical protein SAMN05660964_01710 [Thiothrix caldifontis]
MKKSISRHLLLLALVAATQTGCAQIVMGIYCSGKEGNMLCPSPDRAKILGETYSGEELIRRIFRPNKNDAGEEWSFDPQFFAQQALVYQLQKKPADPAYTKLRQIALDAHYQSDVGVVGNILAQTGTCAAMNIAVEMVASSWKGTPTAPPLPVQAQAPSGYDYPPDPPPTRKTIRETGYWVLNSISSSSDKACLQKVRSQLPPPPSGWEAIP